MVSKLESLFQNQMAGKLLVVLGVFVALVVVFGAGFFIGRSSASSFGLFSPFSRSSTMRSGHGAIGTIQEIKGQTITIESRDGKSRTILISSETQFDKNFEKISLSDLRVNDRILVIGSPNANGQINARLVGILDLNMRPLRNFPLPSGSK